MTGFLRLFISSCALALSYGTVFAQSPGSQPGGGQSDPGLSTGAPPLSDTAASRLAAWNTIDFYHRFMGEESRLLNGYEHLGFLPMNGHPYFQEDNPKIGSIVYEGVWYRDVPLLYDLVRDEVVTEKDNGNLISLYGQKVSEFYLLDHHFISTPTGYYDLLCSGRINLEAKRVKRVLETIENLQVVRNIQYSVHYFVIRDGEWHPIGNLRSLFALLKDKKKEINQDLKKKKIKYRNDHKKALIEAVTYYNQSLPQ